MLSCGEPNSASPENALVLLLEKEGLADDHGRFSASSDSARDLQHYRLPDARRFARRAACEADVDVGRRMAADAGRYACGARHLVAVVRGHQGCASRREISHRSSAVVDD